MKLGYRNIFSIKIVAIVLVIVLGVSCLVNIYLKRNLPNIFNPSPETFAEEGKGELKQTQDQFFNYRIDFSTNEVIIICYNGSMLNQEEIVIIPDEIDGCKVTSLDEGAIAFNEYIHTVVLPPTLKELRRSCIDQCPNLEKLYYSGDSLTIDDDALIGFDGKIVTTINNDLWKYAKNKGIPVEEGEYDASINN